MARNNPNSRPVQKPKQGGRRGTGYNPKTGKTAQQQVFENAGNIRDAIKGSVTKFGNATTPGAKNSGSTNTPAVSKVPVKSKHNFDLAKLPWIENPKKAKAKQAFTSNFSFSGTVNPAAHPGYKVTTSGTHGKDTRGRERTMASVEHTRLVDDYETRAKRLEGVRLFLNTDPSTWTPEQRLQYDFKTGINKDLIALAADAEKIRINDPDFRDLPWVQENILRGMDMEGGLYSIDKGDAYFKRLNKKNYYNEMFYDEETKSYKSRPVMKMNAEPPDITGNLRTQGNYYDEYTYKKGDNYYRRAGSPDVPYELEKDEDGNIKIIKSNYDYVVENPDGTLEYRKYTDEDYQRFMDSWVTYAVFQNAAAIPARMQTERMGYTAGWDINATDSTKDIGTDLLADASARDYEDFARGSRSGARSLVGPNSVHHLFKNVGSYLKTYLFTPLSKGDTSTAVLNGLVNLAETCDYAGIGTRAAAAPILNMLGANIEYEEGTNAWERVATAYTTHHNFDPESDSVLKNMAFYMFADPAVILTLGLPGVAKAYSRHFVRSAFNSLNGHIAANGVNMLKYETPLWREFKSISREIAFADNATLKKHGERVAEIFKDSGYVGNYYGLADETIGALRKLQAQKNYTILKSIQYASDMVNRIDLSFLAGGLYLPYFLLKTAKGTRSILRSNARIAEHLSLKNFEKFMDAQRIYKYFSGESIFDFHHIIDGFKDVRASNASEEMQTLAIEKSKGAWLRQQRDFSASVSRFKTSNLGFSDRVGMLYDDVRRIFKNDINGDAPRDLDELETELAKISERATGINHEADDIIANMLATVKEAKDAVERARLGDAYDWLKDIKSAKTSDDVRDLYVQYLNTNSSHSISGIEELASERYRHLFSEENGIAEALVNIPEDMALINAVVKNDLDAVPTFKTNVEDSPVLSELVATPHTVGDGPKALKASVSKIKSQLDDLVKKDFNGNPIKGKDGKIELAVDSWYVRDLFDFLYHKSDTDLSKVALDELTDKFGKALDSMKSYFARDFRGLPSVDELTKFIEGTDESVKDIFVYSGGPELMREVLEGGAAEFYQLVRLKDSPFDYVAVKPPEKLRHDKHAQTKYSKKLRSARYLEDQAKIYEEAYRDAARIRKALPEGPAQSKQALRHKLESTEVELKNGAKSTIYAEYVKIVGEYNKRVKGKKEYSNFINSLDNAFNDTLNATALTAAQAERAVEVNMAMASFLNEVLGNARLMHFVQQFEATGKYGYLVEHSDEIFDFLKTNVEDGRSVPYLDSFYKAAESVKTWRDALSVYSNFYNTLKSKELGLSPREITAVCEVVLGTNPEHLSYITRQPGYFARKMQEEVNKRLGVDNLLIENYRETILRTSFIDEDVWLPEHFEFVTSCKEEISRISKSDVKLQILQAVEMDPKAISEFNKIAENNDLYFLKTVTEDGTPWSPVVRIELQKWVPVKEDISLSELLKVIEDADKEYSHLFEVSETLTEKDAIKQVVELLDKSVKSGPKVKHTSSPKLATHGKSMFDLDALRQCCSRNEVASTMLANTNALFNNNINTFKRLMGINKHTCIDPDTIPAITNAATKLSSRLPEDASFGIFNLSNFVKDVKTLFDTQSLVKEVSPVFDIEHPVVQAFAEKEKSVKALSVNDYDQNVLEQKLAEKLESLETHSSMQGEGAAEDSLDELFESSVKKIEQYDSYLDDQMFSTAASLYNLLTRTEEIAGFYKGSKDIADELADMNLRYQLGNHHAYFLSSLRDVFSELRSYLDNNKVSDFFDLGASGGYIKSWDLFDTSARNMLDDLDSFNLGVTLFSDGFISEFKNLLKSFSGIDSAGLANPLKTIDEFLSVLDNEFKHLEDVVNIKSFNARKNLSHKNYRINEDVKESLYDPTVPSSVDPKDTIYPPKYKDLIAQDVTVNPYGHPEHLYLSERMRHYGQKWSPKIRGTAFEKTIHSTEYTPVRQLSNFKEISSRAEYIEHLKSVVKDEKALARILDAEERRQKWLANAPVAKHTPKEPPLILPETILLDRELTSIIDDIMSDPAFKQWSSKIRGTYFKKSLTQNKLLRLNDLLDKYAHNTEIPEAIRNNLIALSELFKYFDKFNFDDFSKFVGFLDQYHSIIFDMFRDLGNNKFGHELFSYIRTSHISEVFVRTNQKCALLQHDIFALQNTVSSKIVEETFGIADASPFIRDIYKPLLKDAGLGKPASFCADLENEVSKLNHISAIATSSCLMSREFEGVSELYAKCGFPMGTSGELISTLSGRSVVVGPAYNTDSIGRYFDIEVPRIGKESVEKSSSLFEMDKPMDLLVKQTVESLEKVKALKKAHAANHARIRTHERFLAGFEDLESLQTKKALLLQTQKDSDFLSFSEYKRLLRDEDIEIKQLKKEEDAILSGKDAASNKLDSIIKKIESKVKYKKTIEEEYNLARSTKKSIKVIDEKISKHNTSVVTQYKKQLREALERKAELERLLNDAIDDLVANYCWLKLNRASDGILYTRPKMQTLFNDVQHAIDTTDVFFHTSVALHNIPSHELAKLNKLANRMLYKRNYKVKSLAADFLNKISTLDDWNRIILQTKKFAMALDPSHPYHYLMYLREADTIEDAFVTVDMLYNMFYKHLDDWKKQGIDSIDENLIQVPLQYKGMVSRVMEAGFNSVKMDVENEVIFKLLQGDGLDIVYKDVPKNYFDTSYYNSKISGKHAASANIADILKTKQTREGWARKFASSGTSMRDEFFEELENSQLELLEILNEIAGTPYEAACRYYLDSLQNGLYKAQTLQVMDFITKDVDHLITHLLYHNHMLVLPRRFSDDFAEYGAYLSKLERMLEDKPLYINYKVHDPGDGGYLWVGLSKDANPRVINDTKYVSKDTQYELGGKVYDPAELNNHYQHIGLPDNFKFVDEVIESVEDRSLLLAYCDRLKKYASNCYEKLSFLSEGAIKGSAFAPYSFSKHWAVRKAAPIDWLANNIRTSANCDQRLFHTSQFDFTILGENEYRFRLGGAYDDTDILQNIKYCYDDLAGTVSTERMYIANFFDENSHCKLDKLFGPEYKDEEILTILKNNPEQCVLTLEADANTLTGFRVRKLRITDTLSIKEAKQAHAVVADYETYVEMTRIINSSQFDKKYIKLWAKLVFFLKVGHLCNPGTWMRNWIDATIKATGETGDFGLTAMGQIKAMRYLIDYNKVVKVVRDSYGIHHNTSRRLAVEWDAVCRRAGVTNLTKRQFDFIESWLKVSLSGGESRMLTEIFKQQKRTPWRSANLKPGESFTPEGRAAMRDEFDYLGSDLYRFEQIGEDEIQRLIDEGYRKGEQMFVDDFTPEQFWEIFNLRKNPKTSYIQDSELWNKYSDTAENILMIRSNNLFRGNRSLGSKFDYMCSFFLKPMSKIEQVVRLGQFLTLEGQGYTRSEIFKSIADTQFEYELKSSKIKGAELFMTYFNFEYNNMRYWCNLLEQQPEYLFTLEQFWNDFSWQPTQDLYEDEDMYNNRSMTYMMINGALPIGDSGLYLKMFPSGLGALNWFYGMPSQFMTSVVPPVELLLKEMTYRMGGDYAEWLNINNLDYSYSDQETWEKALSLVPIAGTMYTRYWQHYTDRRPWERLENDRFGVPSIGKDLVHYNPTVWGAIYKYNKPYKGDYDAFQAKLAKQGKWYDNNTDKVVGIEHKNTYALNDPTLIETQEEFDKLNMYKMLYKNKMWDANWGGFINKGHWVAPGERFFTEDGRPKALGLNRKFDTRVPGQWDELCRQRFYYHQQLWDRNLEKFVPFWAWKNEKLNRDDLSWFELCEYMAEKGRYWDAKDHKFKSAPMNMQLSNGIYHYRGWQHFKRWINYGNNPPAEQYKKRRYNPSTTFNVKGKPFGKAYSSSNENAALRMAASGYKAYDEYYKFEFQYNYRYRMPNPLSRVRTFNPIIRYHILPK